MPTPTAARLNRPLMTLSFVFSGSSGCSVLPSSIDAPLPLAHQCVALTPQAMNRAAKRFGNGDLFSAAGELAGTTSAPQTGIDSSHGSAIATPAPRRRVRRETEW